MCGITGWVSATRAVVRPEFEAMTDRLAHRGPDGRGTAYYRDGRVALGHRRLAIQDLSPAGAQPMVLKDEAAGMHIVLTFNGEIYNHPELRRELEAGGARYRTRCDAETILHAYSRWGPDAVQRLRGIFAFAIWDEAKGELFGARDHLGVKPFYCAQLGDDLAFASQICAFDALSGFTREIAPAAFADALRHGVTTGERAIYRGTSRLLPGHCFLWRAGERRTWRYWSPPRHPDIADPVEARGAVETCLAESVTGQMLGDVPVHTLLSGGIDSSLTTAIAAEEPERIGSAFTLGFDNRAFDESSHACAAATAIRCEHAIERLRADEAQRVLDQAVAAFDEPYGIDSALPMVAIADRMAQSGVKVVLSGDGADELFAGYRHYDALAEHYANHGRATANARSASALGILRGVLTGGFSPFPTYTAHNGWFGETAFRAVSGPRLAEYRADAYERERTVFDTRRGPVDAARRADLASYLTDEILVKVDRATMAFGIEARVPLLDHRLVELAFRISPALHHDRGERKAVLKGAAARWLPQSILTARKKGFSLPIADFFLSGPEDERRILAEIAAGPLVREGWLQGERLEAAVARAEYRAGAVLQLLLLDRWYRHWARGAGAA